MTCFLEVVEYACGIASELKGELVENVASGMDTYSIRQPLGVSLAPFTLIGKHRQRKQWDTSVRLIDPCLVCQVVAGICPFNFPAMVPLWMWPLAIAAGNTFILKPSEKDPGASIMLAKLAEQAGLPK